MLFGVVFLSHQVGAFAGALLGGAIYEARATTTSCGCSASSLSLGAALVHLPIHERRAPRLAAGTA